MLKPSRFRYATLLLALFAPLAWGEATGSTVRITQDMPSATVLHQGKPVVIARHPDTENMIEPDYALTSRPCPPFCIQPMILSPGVETLGELELLGYLQKIGEDSSVMVIDSRDGTWPQRSGIIPGAVVLPWQMLHPAHASTQDIADILQFRFNAARQGGLWDFTGAKTLVFYCNGPWCGQSPTNIKQLLALGYPVHKLKWYRGGIQGWKALGLTTVPYKKQP
jgi:rhodanese-related sulfurtransferase